MTSPYDILRSELDRDPARPLLTYYDDATGERIELSVATFDNWVAKTAGLLRDGMGAQPGDRVALALPAHWQALAVTCACWAVGACAVVGLDDDAAVTVTGPDRLDAATRTDSDVLAMALRPLGGRFVETLPPGVLDFALEVPGYPDRFAPYEKPPAEDLALVSDGTAHTFANLLDRARERAGMLGLADGARVLVPAGDLASALSDALLVPLACAGSAVLVRNEDPSGRDARVAAERVDAVIA